MKAVIQRVTSAELHLVDDCGLKESFSSIGQGLVALVAIEKEDTQENADKLLATLLNYRIFADASKRMNLSLLDVQGDLMLVSQFTLAAATNKGTKPSFSSAAQPEYASKLFAYLVKQAQQASEDKGDRDATKSSKSFGLATGKFAANMQITLTNDGPVTFILER